MDITNFIAKLNKLDGNIYTIEEIVTPVDGVYEAELIHDNVEVNTINIYTESKLTGTKINTYTTSTPSLTPWKTIIKIFSTEPVLYITYETTGDTVEAEDINNVQAAINITQEEVNDEIDRATDRENTIENNLNTEISRAENKETEINNNLNTEISRAKKAESDEVTRAKASEKTLTDNLNLEISRAKASESTLTDNLNKEIERAQKAEMDEVTRAKSAEKIITDNLTKEVNRASSAEGILTDNLNAEITRAKDSENTLNTNLTNEINRAKSAENTLTTNLATEVTRAINAENSIKNTINTNKPFWDDKYTKAEIDNKINEVITDLDWKESVTTFSDLSKNYPSPQDGWTVNVKDTDITYRWSGSTWVAISANSIPLATSSVDGKMSKEDKTFLDIVRSLWVSVTSHINDTVKHITSTERTNWNDADSKKHTHDNKSVLDGITSTLITAWNSAYSHISDAVKHITSAERTLWNTVSNKLDKSGGTLTGKLTIQGTAQSKPLNVRGINGIISDNTGDDHLFLNYGTTGNVFINRDGNYVYTYDNLKRVSQLSNDAGYITKDQIDTSQNHVHTNKTTLDKITEDNLTSWNGGVRRTAMIGSDVDGTNGWYKVAEQTCSSYGNQNITFMVTSTYGATNFGLLHLQIRSDNTSIYCSRFGWLSRFGFDVNNFIIVVNGMKWTLYANQTSTRYGRIAFEILSAFAIDRKNDAWPLTFKDNNTKETTAPTATTKSSDIATANHANSATIATQDSDGNQINTTYVKKSTTWNELEGI